MTSPVRVMVQLDTLGPLDRIREHMLRLHFQNGTSWVKSFRTSGRTVLDCSASIYFGFILCYRLQSLLSKLIAAALNKYPDLKDKHIIKTIDLQFFYLSLIQRYACSKAAGPGNSSGFHQYEGHDVVQHAHNMHSYSPSSFLRSFGDCRYSRPSFGGFLVFNHGSIDL